LPPLLVARQPQIVIACKPVHISAVVLKYRASRNAVSAVMRRFSNTISLIRRGERSAHGPVHFATVRAAS